MNKKKADIGMRTVSLVLSLIFLLLILTTIAVRPTELWGDMKDFTCEATYGYLLCDDEKDDENGESWKNGEKKEFDEFNEALRDEDKYTEDYIEENKYEYFKNSIECIKKLELLPSEKEKGIQPYEYEVYLFEAEYGEENVYFTAYLSNVKGDVIPASDILVLNKKIDDGQRYGHDVFRDDDFTSELYLKGDDERKKIDPVDVEFSDLVEKIVTSAERDCVFERVDFDEFNKALRDRSWTDNVIRDKEDFLKNISCLQHMKTSEDYETYLFKSSPSKNENIYFFANFDGEVVSSDSYLKHLSARVNPNDEEKYEYDDIIPEPSDQIEFESEGPVINKMKTSGAWGASEISINGEDDFPELRERLEEIIKDGCGTDGKEDGLEFEIEYLSEEDFISNFNEALRDEGKVKETNLDGYDIRDLEYSLDCLARFEEWEKDLYLFEGVYEEGTIYLTAIINEEGEIVENTCVEVLKATFPGEEEFSTFSEAKDAYENEDEFRETLKLDESGVCKEEGGFAHLLEEPIKASVSKCRG